MNKIFTILIVASSFIACKKTSNTSLTSNTNSVTCVDNPNINFKSIGTPVGKFGDCIKDIDGNTYKTVTIGTQTWMAENLKVNKYNDGTTIPNVTDQNLWKKVTIPAWCYLNNDTIKNSKYGKLYTWYTVDLNNNGNKNVCPTGWHVPTESEWTILTKYLGDDSVAINKMKEVGTTSWSNPNSSTNSSLFTAIASGGRSYTGNFEFNSSNFWSNSSQYTSPILYGRLFMIFTENIIQISSSAASYAASIRCIKD